MWKYKAKNWLGGVDGVSTTMRRGSKLKNKSERTSCCCSNAAKNSTASDFSPRKFCGAYPARAFRVGIDKRAYCCSSWELIQIRRCADSSAQFIELFFDWEKAFVRLRSYVYREIDEYRDGGITGECKQFASVYRVRGESSEELSGARSATIE